MSKDKITATQPRSSRDGVDYININTFGAKTELGKKLSIHHECALVHSTLGPFASIENFWHFVRSGCKDDRLRKIKPTRVRHMVSMPVVDVPHFHKIILDAYATKILSDQQLYEEFVSSTLPFVSYSYFGKKDKIRIDETRLDFILAGLEDLRSRLQTGVPLETIDYRSLFTHLFCT